ncbi:thioredoxin fold domain containing protein [Rhodotorula toruloides]|uniref:Thioredoxin fold domain containing protein n=1 Tax=Rhodotorula toruloides TaxID=5286 RepID=A0A511KGT1_RHOTO|nr:thioredoxin fold domain containing protein [Rhodotorula toruloides]
MPVKLFDLVPQTGGVFFSPPCLRTRLALIHKQLPFEVEEITYHDLRFIWKDRLGVQKATAPIIQREDGSYLMDSDKIAAYLDKAYPDRPNLYLPDSSTPVNLDSAEYSSAKQAAAAEIVNQLHERIKEATANKLGDQDLFFTSAIKPGYTDFYVLCDYRLLRSVSPKLACDVYEADERFAAWLERMKQAYPMPEVWERDPEA